MRPSLHPSVVACTTGEYSSFLCPLDANRQSLLQRHGTPGERLGRGRFGVVYRIGSNTFKVINDHARRGSNLIDVAAEVSALSMNIEGTAKLLDYGIVVDDDATVSYWVVMPEYGASMRSWRESAFNMKNVADYVPSIFDAVFLSLRYSVANTRCWNMPSGYSMR